MTMENRQSRRKYFLILATKLGLRLNHHNIGDFIRNLRSAEYFGEAKILERLVARTADTNESTFIQPFIEMCGEEDLTPEHLKTDEYARFPDIEPTQQPICDICRQPVGGSVCRYKETRNEQQFTFQQLIEEHTAWLQHNFPEQLTDPLRAEDGFDGLVEEVGELARARLKKRQGIRGTQEEWNEQIRDSVGDIVIFLNSWCIAHGINLGECVETAWKEVRERDWKKYPKTGRPPESPNDTAGKKVYTTLGKGTVVYADREVFDDGTLGKGQIMIRVDY